MNATRSSSLLLTICFSVVHLGCYLQQPSTIEGTSAGIVAESVVGRQSTEFDLHVAELAGVTATHPIGYIPDPELHAQIDSLNQKKAKNADADIISHFGLDEYRRTYFTAAQNFSANDMSPIGPIQDFELEFQLSVRHDLWSRLKNKRVAIAYTNHSFWQVGASSAPFRTTDHEPELFFEHDHVSWLPENMRYRIGYSHQSNGKAALASRGWDRVFAEMIVHSPEWFNSHHEPEDKVAYELSVRPWLIVNKSDKNRDIDKYVGYGEIYFDMAFPSELFSRPRISARLRHNLRQQDPRGSIEIMLSYSPPWDQWKGTRFFLKFFNGYGESLLDYNDSSTRLSIGFELARPR